MHIPDRADLSILNMAFGLAMQVLLCANEQCFFLILFTMSLNISKENLFEISVVN